MIKAIANIDVVKPVAFRTQLCQPMYTPFYQYCYPSMTPYNVEDKPKNHPFSIEFPSDPDKMIGNLTADIRYTKVLKYLIKKRKRCNAKKVHYKCRQKVADQRIRVHGRFITKANANMLLEQISAGHDAIPSEINKHLRVTGMENLVNSGRKRRKHNIQTH